jgi:WD40 repeat protein
MTPPSAFDPKAIKLLASYAVPGALFAVCLDESRRVLFGAGTDGAVHSVDLGAEKPGVKKWPVHDNYVSGLALTGTGLISAGFDRKLVWTDPATGERLRTVHAHDGWVRKVVATPDGKHLVTVGDDMRVKMWEAATGKLLLNLAGHAERTPEGYLSALYALAVSPDGRHAASGDRAGFIRIWDLTTGRNAAEFRASEMYTFDAVKRARAMGGVRGLAFSPDGTRLAVSGIGAVTNVDGFVGPCRMELWDWKAGKRIAVGQEKHQAILNALAFLPKSSALIGAGGGDSGGALVYWNPTGAPDLHVAKPKGHLHAFALDAAGVRLHGAGHGGFQVWQLRHG